MRLTRYLEGPLVRWGYLCPSCAEDLSPKPKVVAEEPDPDEPAFGLRSRHCRFHKGLKNW